MQRKNPTLAKRYLFKLLANVASVPVYLAMEAILPRALGPKMYGNYSFATNLFYQMAGFLDMGTSTCFYNSLSRRQTEAGLIAYYMRASFLVLCITMAVSAVFFAVPSCGSLFMPDVPLWLAPLAAFWAFLTWWSRVLRSMNDAIGATVSSEMVRTVVSLLAVVALGALFFFGLLDIGTLFLQQYFMLGFTAIGFWFVTVRYGRGQWLPSGTISMRLTKEQKKAYFKEFFDYSNPLFVQALLAFFMLTTERWLLQWFDGSAQQGFFALSQKVSMACFLFVSAMTPLLMRELSIAWGKHDVTAMAHLVNRFAPLLYIVAAYFSCFTLAEAPFLVRLFGGSEFTEAILPVQIMALYPLHQGYGQLATSIFHASSRTKVLRNMQALECVYGLSAAWFLIAPASLWGLGLGATGLAIKTVCVQFISVNLYMWIASRFVPLAFWRNLFHQIWSLALLLGLAFGCRWLTQYAGLGSLDSFVRFFCSGVLYTAVLALVGVLCPALLGLSREEVRDFVKRVRHKQL